MNPLFRSETQELEFGAFNRLAITRCNNDTYIVFLICVGFVKTDLVKHITHDPRSMPLRRQLNMFCVHLVDPFNCVISRKSGVENSSKQGLDPFKEGIFFFFLKGGVNIGFQCKLNKVAQRAW